MRGILLLLVATIPAAAADERHAERLGDHKHPYRHTAEASGTDKCPRHAKPSVTSKNIFGYVNGSTFGMDYLGCGHFPQRVFPGFISCRLRSNSHSDKYATDSRFPIKDLIAAAPFRKAIKAAKAEKHEGENGH